MGEPTIRIGHTNFSEGRIKLTTSDGMVMETTIARLVSMARDHASSFVDGAIQIMCRWPVRITGRDIEYLIEKPGTYMIHLTGQNLDVPDPPSAFSGNET